MHVRAPAKINLNLRILGRNDTTGFHDLETWMVPLTLADELHVKPTTTPGIQLTCSDPELEFGSGNLAWRAADLFLRETSRPGGATIELHKHIPHGAGLGGGSSDAAAVLKALNAQAPAPLDDRTLAALAAQLGSDVPFFLRAEPSLARGRGEILEPCPLRPPLDLLLIKPPFAVETAWAYRQWDTDVTVPSRWTAPQLHDGIEIFNDLERPVFAKYLILAALKEWLLEHSLVAAAAMSGSGSCLFAILRDPRGADQLAAETQQEFGDTFWTAACCTTCSGGL
jgi:4-diphosphocytidyl-2-C-methyl-D-erythritol kinase